MLTSPLVASALHLLERLSASARRHRITRKQRPEAARPRSPARALTLAAMALPGVATGLEIESGHVQFSRYQEGGRDFWPGPEGTLSEPDPIEIDQLSDGFTGWFTDRLKFAFDYLQDTWSGATPILTAPEAFITVTGASAYPRTSSFADAELVPYGPDLVTGQRVPQPQLLHMVTSASAETRREADLTVSREWDEATADVGLGISDEPDYQGRFASVNVYRDLDRKLTTLNAGVSYTSSDVKAILGPVVDWTDYGLYLNVPGNPTITEVDENGQTIRRFSGDRTDWSVTAGLAQILGSNSTFSTGLTYTHNRGFLENPYKLVMFAFADPDVALGGLQLTRLFNVPEDRPDTRRQWTWNARLSRYFARPDAGLHLDYRMSDDNWGITAHTVEVTWSQAFGSSWIVTPRVRYYSQDAAEFYAPYFILAQSAPIDLSTGGLDFGSLPVPHYSSDHRLSGFGALSGGLIVRKQLAGRLSLEGGVEFYTHDGGLKLGGGGEDSYADFHYYMLSLALKVDVGTESTGLVADADHLQHAEHRDHAGHEVPAGLMYGHMLSEAQDFMMGYRYMYARQSGDILRGSHVARDADIIANGCGDFECSVAPDEMTMNMHMLDLMYGPSDWFTLMVMLQYMDMEMTMRSLEGAAAGGGGHHGGGGHNRHTTAGVGDTVIAGLVRLADAPMHRLHLGLGVSLPTGDVDEKMTDGQLQHYGMQPGSGTWDYLPSLTYAGQSGPWSWGGQVSGVLRGHGPNDSGYTLGDIFQGTVWLGHDLTSMLSASVRGIYTTQGDIDGQFDPPQPLSGPMDSPASYGGDFWDIAAGLSVVMPGRAAQGDRITVEWVQPITDHVNGYQLERDGSLSLTFSLNFE
jgi:hypothetical protein